MAFNQIFLVKYCILSVILTACAPLPELCDRVNDPAVRVRIIEAIKSEDGFVNYTDVDTILRVEYANFSTLGAITFCRDYYEIAISRDDDGPTNELPGPVVSYRVSPTDLKVVGWKGGGVEPRPTALWAWVARNTSDPRTKDQTSSHSFRTSSRAFNSSGVPSNT